MKNMTSNQQKHVDSSIYPKDENIHSFRRIHLQVGQINLESWKGIFRRWDFPFRWRNRNAHHGKVIFSLSHVKRFVFLTYPDTHVAFPTPALLSSPRNIILYAYSNNIILLALYLRRFIFAVNSVSRMLYFFSCIETLIPDGERLLLLVSRKLPLRCDPPESFLIRFSLGIGVVIRFWRWTVMKWIGNFRLHALLTEGGF